MEKHKKRISLQKKLQPREQCAQTETDGSYQHGATPDPNIANYPTTYLNLTQNPQSSNTSRFPTKLAISDSSHIANPSHYNTPQKKNLTHKKKLKNKPKINHHHSFTFTLNSISPPKARTPGSNPI